MILFIDDERRRMQSFVDALSFNYEVEFESNIDKAISIYQKEIENIELIILDIMMPSGIAFDNLQTEDGLRTGICLYHKKRIILEKY